MKWYQWGLTLLKPPKFEEGWRRAWAERRVEGRAGHPPDERRGSSPPRCLSRDDSLRSISGSRQSGPIETSGRVRGGPPNASRWLGRPAESAERGQARASPQSAERRF